MRTIALVLGLLRMTIIVLRTARFELLSAMPVLDSLVTCNH